MINCAFCKTPFEPKKPKAKYCSDKCRTYAGRGVDRANPKPRGRPFKTGLQMTIESAHRLETDKVAAVLDILGPMPDDFTFPNDLDKITPGSLDKYDLAAYRKEIPEQKPGKNEFIGNPGIMHPVSTKPDPFPVLPVTVKPVMPKGLSVQDQLQWKIDNL